MQIATGMSGNLLACERERLAGQRRDQGEMPAEGMSICAWGHASEKLSYKGDELRGSRRGRSSEACSNMYEA